MRTVLYRIHLLIDNMIIRDRVFTRNQMEWGESKTGGDREREGERQSVAENERWRGQ